MRWESIEILLGPEAHVPFLQFALWHWNLVHPDTGVDFPVILPAACLPLEMDEEVHQWREAFALDQPEVQRQSVGTRLGWPTEL